MTVLISAATFIAGVMATLILEDLFSPTWRKIRMRIARRRIEQRFRGLDDVGDVFWVGGEGIYLHQFVPGGWQPGNIQFVQRDAESFEESIARADPELLPETPEELARRVSEERDRLEDPSFDEWDGDHIAVERIITRGRTSASEKPVIRIEARSTKFSVTNVCTHAWEDFYRDRSRLFPMDHPQFREGVPGMLNAVGLNATVVTSDGFLVLTRRNARMSSGRGGRHISVNEGMQPSDVLGGSLDPAVGLVRGIDEELGISDVESSLVRFHSAIFDLDRYQFGLLGHVDLSGTDTSWQRVTERRLTGIAKDKVEARRLERIPWNPDAVIGALMDPDWVAHGWVNLLLSAISSFPTRADDLLKVQASVEGVPRINP